MAPTSTAPRRVHLRGKKGHVSRSLAPPLGPLERRLLLNSARTELDPSRLAETELLLEGSLEWKAVLFHARLHSVASLLYAHLARLDRWEALPEYVRPHLLGLYHRSAYQNRIFASENSRLLEGFAAKGIQAIVPKGISLVERDYGDLALRPLIDLVFLMPEDQVQAATRVLRRRGYWRRKIRPVEATWRWCCPQRAFSIKL